MLSGSSLSCRSPPCSHTAISSTSLTVLLQASDLVRYTLSPADLNPSPPRFDLRAVRCHLLVLPFLQNFHQLTVAHSACMCHNLFAVMYFSHIYFTTNEKPRRPFWATLASCFSGLFCYSPFCAFRMILSGLSELSWVLSPSYSRTAYSFGSGDGSGRPCSSASFRSASNGSVIS